MRKVDKFLTAVSAAGFILLRLLMMSIAALMIFVGAVHIIDRIPKTIDIKENGDYQVCLQAVGSPVWAFGPQDGRIILKKSGKTVAKADFELHNDGKGMNESNWSVSWDDVGVSVTISGEEQPDATFWLGYTEIGG